MSLNNYPNSSLCFGSLVFAHVVLVCFTIFLKPVDSLGNETDRLSLLKLKESIPGDPHGLLGSWNDSVHFCDWLGVECSVRHRRVTSLSLEGYDLRGTISPHIGNLSFLRLIRLGNNNFSGEIPQQIGHLFRLRQLHLSFNMLEGNIPLNLTYCSQLRVLYLLENRLIGKIPAEIGSLSDLRILSLARNNLTGGIPPSLGNISSLRVFELSNSNLQGVVPSELGRLKSLTFFAIGLNNLSGTIPLSIYNVSSLQSFVVSVNRLEGTIPSTVGSTLPNLKSFLNAANQFSGKIPESFSNASQLEKLSVSENNFVGQVPKNLGNLQKLFHLSLFSNKLGNYSVNSFDFIPSLTNCSALQVLSLSMNNLGGDLPKSIANLSTNLEALYLGDNIITGNVPPTLENLVNLTILALEYNLFAGVIPSSLGKLKNLQVLSMTRNMLSGKLPSSLGNLTNMFALQLSDNKFEGRIPPGISKYSQRLQRLSIANNRLSGSIPRDIFSPFSSLIQLNLSINRFSGGLPVEVGNLKNLFLLDLSNNNLTGEIPEPIKGCESVTLVDLHRNFFQGSLPFALASLRNLQFLDLSHNNLTGTIPKELEKLSFLIYLNISFNHMEGEVPSKGVFGNSSGLSIVGNEGLCGGIPKLRLPRCTTNKGTKRGTSGLKLTTVIVCVAAFLLLFSGYIIFYWRRKSTKKSSPTVSTIGLHSKVSYRVLYQATNAFSPTMLIGVGSFSSVYKGILNEEENPIAVKVLNLQKKGAEKSFIAECKALRTIKHRNLVKVLTCCSSMDYNGNEFKALVFEYMPNGSLDKWLHIVNDEENQSRSLTLIQRVNIAIDVASAIHYLHAECGQPVIHRDLKPSNVLLDNEMIAHVSDFGVARLISNNNDFSDGQTSTTGIKGTIGYVAPEYATGSESSKQGDTYSFGILLLEMFTGKRPTDEIFKDDCNLHNFVKTALPERLVQTVDSALLYGQVEETATTTANNVIYGNNNSGCSEIDEEQRNIRFEIASEIGDHLRKCLVLVLEIGLACSQELPDQRMNMEQVIRDLKHIKKAYESVKELA